MGDKACDAIQLFVWSVMLTANGLAGIVLTTLLKGQANIGKRLATVWILQIFEILV